MATELREQIAKVLVVEDGYSEDKAAVLAEKLASHFEQVGWVVGGVRYGDLYPMNESDAGQVDGDLAVWVWRA